MDDKVIDRLTLFLGKPYKYNDNISIYSPTVNKIDDITENRYQVYVLLCTFNAKDILVNLLGLEEDKFDELSENEYYPALVSHPDIRDETCSALSFFCGKQVTFEVKDSNDFGSYMVDDDVFVNIYNFIHIGKVIKELNVIDDKEEKEEKPKFANKIAEEFWITMNKLKKESEAKKKKKEGISLKDILSILSIADGNGINVFNCKELTIYQVYEQFERLGMKESYSRILPVWANGHLDTKKGGKLPEWIASSKL